MARTIGYRWHLRRLMADQDMYATTQLRPLLAERGVVLSREQVYRGFAGEFWTHLQVSLGPS